MKKSEVIALLEAIEGDPEVLIKQSGEGITYQIDEVEEAVCSPEGDRCYTFSKDRAKAMGAHEPCILLWTKIFRG